LNFLECKQEACICTCKAEQTIKKGGNKGIRTLGPCLAKAVLYQLSYIPDVNPPFVGDNKTSFFFSKRYFKLKEGKGGGPYWT